jgi:putative addiction module component (TIGR02574 family)
MASIVNELAAKILTLSNVEKLQLVDSILMELDRPNPDIDRVWAEEARRRWEAYKAGKTEGAPVLE